VTGNNTTWGSIMHYIDVGGPHVDMPSLAPNSSLPPGKFL